MGCFSAARLGRWDPPILLCPGGDCVVGMNRLKASRFYEERVGEALETLSEQILGKLWVLLGFQDLLGLLDPFHLLCRERREALLDLPDRTYHRQHLPRLDRQ